MLVMIVPRILFPGNWAAFYITLKEKGKGKRKSINSIPANTIIKKKIKSKKPSTVKL